MKRIIALLLMLTMVFAVCGCKKDEEDVRGEIVEEPVEIVEEKTDVSQENAMKSIKEEISNTDKFSLGKTSGKVYTNDFIGIGLRLGDDWSFYNDDQIKEINNVTKDVAGEDFAELMENASIIYDMYATNDSKLNNININLEKMDNATLAALNIEENYKSAFPYVEEALGNMGYENLSYTISPVEVDGRTLDAIHITGEINGINFYQTAFSVKCNGYLANVTISTMFDDTSDELLNRFYWTK